MEIWEKELEPSPFFFTILFLVILIPSLLRADVIISEMCDPLNGYATDRYIEIYNTGVSAVDLTGWTLYSIGNDNETYQTWPLSGSIASAEALVCGKEGNIYADFTNTSANTSWNGDSNDGARLLNDSAVVVDYVKDAAAAYFSNSSYVRKATVENAVAVYDSGEWDKLAVSDINTGNSTPGTHTCDYPVPTPPAGISSLSALVGLSNGTVRLKWLDPGADGIGGGNVSSYEVKYATFCIDSEENYAAATTYDAASAWSAGTFGTEHEIKTVSGLIDAATYWFAI
ncbi:MAG: lamin tail domain-containing protein, partial [bacterium]